MFRSSPIPAFVAALFLILTTARVAPAATAPEAEKSDRDQLGSTVWSWDDMVVKHTPVGARRDIADNPTPTLERFECHISTLNPGLSSHAPHRHAQEEFIIIKEGTLDVGINGELQRVGPGSMFFFAANDWHNVNNVGDGPATYLVFNLATARTRTAPLDGAAKTAGPEVLHSAVWNWEKLAPTPTSVGQRRFIFDAPTVTCTNLAAHAITLEPGQAAHAPHRHADEEVVIVKEGRVQVTINGTARVLGSGSICFIASNDDHDLRNAGDEAAVCYLVRVTTEATPGPSENVTY